MAYTAQTWLHSNHSATTYGLAIYLQGEKYRRLALEKEMRSSAQRFGSHAQTTQASTPVATTNRGARDARAQSTHLLTRTLTARAAKDGRRRREGRTGGRTGGRRRNGAGLVPVEDLVDDLALGLLLDVEPPLHVRDWAAVTGDLDTSRKMGGTRRKAGGG